LIFPIYLGIFLKVCAYPKKEWAGKKRWMLITGCWGFSHTQRAVQDIWKIWGPVYKGKGLEGVCGLKECKGLWVEEALIVLVVIAQLRGWKWDNGLVDRWIQGVITQEKLAAERAKTKDSVERMEKGEEIETAVVVEDAEKRELMARDGIVVADVEEKEAVLVEIDEVEVEKKGEEVKA